MGNALEGGRVIELFLEKWVPSILPQGAERFGDP